MDVLLHDVGTAAIPLNNTWLEPCDVPKSMPDIVTGVPAEPKVGDMEDMLAVTLKLIGLLEDPPDVITTGPLADPEGTVATIELLSQLPVVA